MIEDRDWLYILGVRMRSSHEAPAVVDAEGPFTEVFPERETSHDPSPLQVKVLVAREHRYIVCLNPEQARKDRHDREAIVSALRGTLPHGDKSLVGNKGWVHGEDGHRQGRSATDVVRRRIRRLVQRDEHRQLPWAS